MRRRAIDRSYVAAFLVAVSVVPFASFGLGSIDAAAVSGPGYWGTCETFWNVSTGTDAPSSFHGFTLHETAFTDAVVLDGFLYLMTKADMAGTTATYAPPEVPGRTNDWNLSVEVTRPREGSAYESSNISEVAGLQALIVYATNSTGEILAGVKLVTGNPASEAIYIFDATTASWEPTSSDLRPAFPHRTDSSGLKPDRYIVSFSHADLSALVRAAIVNTATGAVFVREMPLPTLVGTGSPGLRLDIDSDVGKVGVYNVAGGWMLDNFAFRSSLSRYPIAGPAYEVVSESDPLWVQIVDGRGQLLDDASVSINGTAAAYNPASQRYEAHVPRAVDWDVPIRFSAIADGVSFDEIVKVSTIPDPADRLSFPKWWNGWDWVTAFGRDDSSSTMSTQQTFYGYNHPATNYISSSFLGNSTELLSTQSEIAVHFPHDYSLWGHKTWNDAVDSSQTSQDYFGDIYWFASRWDDPRYVGEGDTYISVACPGNSASWEQVYARYAGGARIMGISAQYYLGGNSSLLGSYWLYGPNLTSLPSWGSWDPHARMDMMDMFRAISTDTEVRDQWIIARAIAEGRGVLRLYNHGTIAVPSFVRWLCDEKQNLSYENWKATDGEVASYVYGRASVDADYSPESTRDLWVYNLSRKDPIPSGYWRVPVSVALNISEKMVMDIEISSGGQVLRMSDGSLRSLNGSRTMDVGYDIRGNTLYVSHFWNESATLKVLVSGLFNPRFVEDPKSSGVAWEEFRTRLNSTQADNGTNEWALVTAPDWLAVLESNDTSFLLGGFPKEPGVFDVVVRVSDANNTALLVWSITIHKLKIVEGYVTDATGDMMGGSAVMIAIKDGKAIRTIEYTTTDEDGFYSLVFGQGTWTYGDTIEVSASRGNVTSVNATMANNYPHQEIDLRLQGRDDRLATVLIAAAAFCGVAAAVVTLVVLRRRKKPKRSAGATSRHP